MNYFLVEKVLRDYSKDNFKKEYSKDFLDKVYNLFLAVTLQQIKEESMLDTRLNLYSQK